MAKNGHDRVGENRRKFRAILKRKKMTPMPGGFSPLYALLAQEAGFECFFLPGSQLSHFLYGVPDNGIIGLRDLVDHARHMAAHADIPILVDADTATAMRSTCILRSRRSSAPESRRCRSRIKRRRRNTAPPLAGG